LSGAQEGGGGAADARSRSITGHAQMDWLLGGLKDSEARWKIVGNPVMISRLDFGTLPAWLLGPLAKLIGIPSNGYAPNPDAWDGYNADREQLVNYLRAHELSNVVFITGDIHTSWAS